MGGGGNCYPTALPRLLRICLTTKATLRPWSPYHYELVVLPANGRKCYGCTHEFGGEMSAASLQDCSEACGWTVLLKDPLTGSFASLLRRFHQH